MQIPAEWYVHILPGIVILSSLLLLRERVGVVELLTFARENALGSALFLGIVGYLAGVVGNAFALNVLRPIFICIGWLNTPELLTTREWVQFHLTMDTRFIQIISDGYQNMVLLRSVFGGFCLLSISSAVGLAARRNYLLKRATMLAVLIVSTIVLGMQWLNYRTDYQRFFDNSIAAFRHHQAINRLDSE